MFAHVIAHTGHTYACAYGAGGCKPSNRRACEKHTDSRVAAKWQLPACAHLGRGQVKDPELV